MKAKLKIKIEGTGSLEDIIESLEATLKGLQGMKAAKDKLYAEDENISAVFSDKTSKTVLCNNSTVID